MEPNVKPVLLNLGCGEHKLVDHINVDAYGDPDYKWDLQEFPFPWDDNSIDGIEAWHIFEHLPDWWSAFEECARILKPGGYLHIHVPDESNRTALTYRDHYHVFSKESFHGIQEGNWGTNSWAETIAESVPLTMYDYRQVPFTKFNWMIRFPRLLQFCAAHMRGFIWEQRFYFRKIGR